MPAMPNAVVYRRHGHHLFDFLWAFAVAVLAQPVFYGRRPGIMYGGDAHSHCDDAQPCEFSAEHALMVVNCLLLLNQHIWLLVLLCAGQTTVTRTIVQYPGTLGVDLVTAVLTCFNVELGGLGSDTNCLAATAQY